MTSITIPDSVTSIGYDAFDSCTSLASVTIPDGVTDISCAFIGCSSLKNIIIPNSVTDISGAFIGCLSLAEITIPDGVTDDISLLGYWDIYCDDGYGGYISGYIQTFSGCNSLTEINVSSNNSGYLSVDGVLFTKDGTEIVAYPAGKADESYYIPDTTTSIARAAFYNCKNLSQIYIPNGVQTIDIAAFYGCSNIESISIPSGVSVIDMQVLEGCTSLERIYIPASVTQIGGALGASMSVDDNNLLSDIYYEGSQSDWENIIFMYPLYDQLNTVTIHYNSAGLPEDNETEPLPEQSFTATEDGAVTNGGEEEQTAAVIIASYDEDGAMLDVSSETVTFAAGETIEYPLEENERIFVWNSLAGMYPLTAE